MSGCEVDLNFDCAYGRQAKNASENEPILLISSVDGSLIAISKYTGAQLWHIRGGKFGCKVCCGQLNAPFFRLLCAEPLVRLSLPLDSRYFTQYDDDNKALRHYHVMPDPDDGTMYLYSYTLPPESEPEDAANRAQSTPKQQRPEADRSRSEVIRKLPFTIPELVQRSPYPSHDGIMYTGPYSPRLPCSTGDQI